MSIIHGKRLTYLKTTVVNRFPRIYLLLSRMVSRCFLFGAEREFLRGRLEAHSSAPSLLFFTYNRCASQFISSLLVRAVQEEGLIPIDLRRYFFHAYPSREKLFQNPEFIKQMLGRRGFYFGPLRPMPSFAEYDDVKTILVLRDPRDVLTSRYYSVALSHVPNDTSFVAARKRAATLTIDEFVLERADEVLSVYQFYAEELLGRANVLYLRYESMVLDYAPWLDLLLSHVAPNASRQTRDDLLAKGDFSVSSENVRAHKRSVLPGQHRRKLQAKTIGRLNEIFSGVMSKLEMPL